MTDNIVDLFGNSEALADHVSRFGKTAHAAGPDAADAFAYGLAAYDTARLEYLTIGITVMVQVSPDHPPRRAEIVQIAAWRDRETTALETIFEIRLREPGIMRGTRWWVRADKITPYRWPGP